MEIWNKKLAVRACVRGLRFDLVGPRSCRPIQYQDGMAADVSLACQRTQLAGQIMRHWHAAIFIYFVSRDQVLSLHVFGSLFTFLSVLLFHSDLSPPPLAPFDHRIVTPKPHQIASYYTINRDEVLGG